MTSAARVAQMRARREQDFLAVCVEYEDRLAAAKKAAKETPDEGTFAALKAAKQEMRAFREWARTFGRPSEGRPGRDATVKIGGAVSGVGR